jgi:hypothetical protein
MQEGFVQHMVPAYQTPAAYMEASPAPVPASGVQEEYENAPAVCIWSASNNKTTTNPLVF